MRTILTLVAAGLLVASPAAAQRRPASSRAGSSPAYWEMSLGMSGGYTNSYVPGQGTVYSFSAPFIGSSAVLTTLGIVTPPSLFAIIPLSGRWAIEPALDYHSISVKNSSRFSSALLSARADYALGRIWYAAVGGQVSYLDGSGVSGEMRAGATLGVGARVRVTSGLAGRLEMNYGFLHHSTSVLSQQSLSFLVGLVLPI
ncbi:MAG TPA: hypothetical protein VFI39_11600 [Gemmatimonadales bacterium]|nr:hypothetical protein [Gemmatimonadales bacterium]